jgi:hypothetical protein
MGDNIKPLSIKYTRPFLYPYQKQILDSEKRYTVTEASTKVGKTASHIIWLLEQALKIKENQSVWWVAPVYGQAEIAYNRMKSQVSETNFFKSNEQKLQLTLPTGAKIQFKSAERPDNLYGDDVYAAVFDEFTRSREESWFALRSTLTATKGKCKFIGNVKGRSNWGYKLAVKAMNGEQDFDYFKITAYDAVREGLLDIAEVEAAKRELPEIVFRELYLAEPADNAANPFGFQFIKQCTIPMSTEPPVCFGVDLAKSFDWTVIIGLDRFGQVSYLERFQKDWNITKQIVTQLPKAPIKVDSTGVGDPIVEDLQRQRQNVFGFKYSASSKQQLMEGLQSAIHQRKVGFPEGVITKELESFEYEYTRTGVRFNAPTGMHDDCVNALALAWAQFMERKHDVKYVFI